jgi:imidazolonepropionase-like amidohydrolase
VLGATARASEVVVRGGLLIDGTGRDPQPGVGLVIRGGVIVQVAPDDGLDFSSDAQRCDAEGRAILPGLIDSHTHLTYHGTRLDLWQQELEESIEVNTLKAAQNARAILGMGISTIGDGGCRGFIGPGIRDGIRMGLIPGPRVVATGPIICGSAGLEDHMPAWARYESDTQLGRIVTGPAEVRSEVRRQVKGGVDWIKVAASGVAGSRFSNAEQEDLTYEEIVAAVEEARKFGMRVHAHAHSRESVKACARAGVLSIHSGEFVDEEGLELLKQHGMVFAPTIAWLQARTLDDYPPSRDPKFWDEAHRAFVAAARAIVRAREVGTKVAIGTDASHRFFHVPDAALEMEYFAHLGYTALEIITAATKTAAEAIDRGDSLGTLEAGKRGDVLIVSADVAEDVTVLRDKRNIARQLIEGVEVELDPARGVIGRPFSVRDALGELAVSPPTAATTSR